MVTQAYPGPLGESCGVPIEDSSVSRDRGPVSTPAVVLPVPCPAVSTSRRAPAPSAAGGEGSPRSVVSLSLCFSSVQAGGALSRSPDGV